MRRMTWSLAVVVVLFASIADAQQDAKAKSGATAFFGITVDPDASGMNSSIVDALFRSQSVLKDAIAEVSAEAAKSLSGKIAEVRIDGRPSVGRSSTTYTVFVFSFDERVPADKLLEPLGQALEQRLGKIDAGRSRDIARVSDLKHDLQKTAEELAERQGQLLHLASDHGVSPNPELSAQQQMRVETELQNLGVELHGLKARQRVLERQVAELAKRMAEGEGGDPAVLKELRNAVQARKKVLEQKQYLFEGPKTVGPEDLEIAKYELANAEVELAKYRREAAEKAGGGRIAELKGRLEDTAIEMAEIEARREALREQLDKMLKGSLETEMKRLEAERLKRDYAETSAQLARLRLKLSLYSPPTVQVIPVE